MRKDLCLPFLVYKYFCARSKMGALFAKVRASDFFFDLFLVGKVGVLSIVELALSG